MGLALKPLNWITKLVQYDTKFHIWCFIRHWWAPCILIFSLKHILIPICGLLILSSITAHNPPSTMVSKQKLFSHTVMAFNCMSVQEPRYLSDQITTRIAVTRRMT